MISFHLTVSVKEFDDSAGRKTVTLSCRGKSIIVSLQIFQYILYGLIRNPIVIITDKRIVFHVRFPAFGTNEASLPVKNDTFLMGINGVSDLLQTILFYIGVKSTAAGADMTAVLEPDLFINDPGFCKLT